MRIQVSEMGKIGRARSATDSAPRRGRALLCACQTQTSETFETHPARCTSMSCLQKRRYETICDSRVYRDHTTHKEAYQTRIFNLLPPPYTSYNMRPILEVGGQLTHTSTQTQTWHPTASTRHRTVGTATSCAGARSAGRHLRPKHARRRRSASSRR